MQPDAVAEFVTAFTRATNAQRRDEGIKHDQTRRALQEVERKLAGLYDAIADGEDAPPETLILEVDPDPALFDGTGIVTQSERECIEENNTTEVPITDEALPDLALVSVSSSINACPDLEVTVEVSNLGSAAVSGVEVSFFAGQPDLGGTFLGSVVRTEALAPGDSATLSTDLDLTSAGLVGYLLSIHALVRPLESVDECNLSNNVLAEEEETFCPAG